MTAARIALAVAASLLVALSITAEAASGVSNDVYWLLHAADRLLDGAVLYRDVVDTNPPLSVWIYLPAAFTARLTGLSGIAVMRGFVVLAGVAALVASDQSLRRAGLSQGARLVIGATAAIAVFTLPLAAFGQREHLVLLLSLPYVTSAVARAGGGTAGIPVSRRLLDGVLLGLGIALKPFYAALWLGTELLLARRGRQEGPRRLLESAAVVAVGAVYVVLAFTVAGDFQEVLPVLLELYPRYEPEPAGALLGRYPFVWFAGASLAAGLAARGAGARGPLPAVLAVAALGTLIAALVQGKGYPYHFYPATAYALLLLGGIVAALPSRARIARFVAVAGLALPLAYVLAAAMRLALGPLPAERRALANLQAAAGPIAGRSVAALSPKTGLAMWLAAYGNGRWALRHSCMWVPVTIYEGSRLDPDGAWMNPPDEMTSEERWFFEGTVVDLTRHRPDFLLVQLPQADPLDVRRGIDWIRYFGQDERFRTLLTEYDEVGRAEGYAVLRHRGGGRPAAH